MKWVHWWVLTILTLTGGAFFYYGIPHTVLVGPAAAYPNPQFTTGKIATISIQELTATNPTYSQSHRNVPQSVKDTVKKEYGCTVGEVDHFIPLAVGGANDISNLWCEPAQVKDSNGNDWGYHTKDILEAYMARGMKKGIFTVQQAQQCFLVDWVSCYQAHLGTPQTALHYGSTNPYEEDTDDEVESY